MLHARDHVVLAAILCVLAAGCAKPRAVETTPPTKPAPSAAATAPPTPPPPAPSTEAPAPAPAAPAAEKPAAPAMAAPAPAAPAPAPAPPAPAPSASEPKLLYIKTGFANFRAEPGLKGKVLAVLKKGARLTVLEEKDQWYRVKLDDGRQGWVAESVAGASK